MQHRTEDLFRYTFFEPIHAWFTIVQINNTPISIAKGPSKIIDISLGGLKLNSHLYIPYVNEYSIFLDITFMINESALHVIGEIVWHKTRNKTHDYGVQLWLNNESKKNVLEALTTYSKQGLFLVE